MSVALEAFRADYGGDMVEIAVGEFVVVGHELARRFPSRFTPDASSHSPRRESARRGGGSSPSRRAAAVPVVRHLPRYTVELSSFAYRTIDGVDGLGDGRECGGGLFGVRTLEGVRVEDCVRARAGRG